MVERGLRDPRRERADRRSGLVEGPHGEREPAAFGPEPVRGRDTNVFEADRARRRGPMPHLVLILARKHARRGPRDDERRDPLVSQARVHRGEDRIERGVRSVGDEALLPREDIVVPVPARDRPHRSRVRPPRGLGERERGEVVFGAERLEEPLLLFGRSIEQDGLEGETIRDDGGRHPAAGVGQLLDDEALFERGQPTAPVVGGNVEVHEAEVERLPIDLLGEAGSPVALGRVRSHLGAGELPGEVA